jgi:uncharacterized membrane-anchored protein YitT (DUF2179 family)
MAIFKVGPDGMLIVFALVVSIVLAVLSWRRIGLMGTGVAVMSVAVTLAIVQFFMLDPADPIRQMVRASFIVVPSAVLLGASRVSWLAHHAWLFVVLGRLFSPGAMSASATSASNSS